MAYILPLNRPNEATRKNKKLPRGAKPRAQLKIPEEYVEHHAKEEEEGKLFLASERLGEELEVAEEKRSGAA